MKALSLTAFLTVLALSAALGLSGCATTGAGSQETAQPAFPAGQSCQAIRSEMLRMETKGVAKLAERQQNGSKLSSAQQTDVSNYDRLMSEYINGRCHLS